MLTAVRIGLVPSPGQNARSICQELGLLLVIFEVDELTLLLLVALNIYLIGKPFLHSSECDRTIFRFCFLIQLVDTDIPRFGVVVQL